jgi:Ca2+-transporting ATPase
LGVTLQLEGAERKWIEMIVHELSGLSSSKASELLKSVGFNELPSSERKSVLGILFRVLQEPMLLLLLACGLIYVLAGELRDGILLFVSALIVVGITLYQEVKSERALDALRDLSSPRALVVRDGVTRRISGREVVPGDLVQLAEGDRIPADAILISSTHFSVDESLLTGESFSVEKTPSAEFTLELESEQSVHSRLYSGTLVVGGQGFAVVTQTGPKTELGKIGKSLETASEPLTPLQKEINQIVRVFGLLGIAFSVSIAVIYGFTRGDWPKGILAGLAAAMSLLPEEFPVVMTIFLAMGAWRIARKQVLARRVAAIEALGSISTLCVDKTGTLTQNKMAVRIVRTANSVFDLTSSQNAPQDARELLSLAALACHETPFDPMEKAIIESFRQQERESTRNTIPVGSYLRLYPLSSGLMAMSCAWQNANDSSILIASKGAPEAILSLCHASREDTKLVLAQVQELASQGLRVLAVARATHSSASTLPENQHDFYFSFVGLLSLEDPIRQDVPAAIRECQGAGIRVLMLTGDYPGTARSIAQKLGLPDQVTDGQELSRTDDLRLQQIVRSTSVFARVTPEQKLRIVTALKLTGERVAMTGDGVNDAPSLKWADIGVAMGGRGTDVAREASAIVLLDDSFTSMVSAIRLGRRIYDNLQKAIFFILAIHVPIAGLTILPVILKLPLILLPVHIVFLELIIDPACSLIYEAEKEEADIMIRKPRKAKARIVQPRDLLATIAQGTVILGLVLAIYTELLHYGHPVEQARAGAFLTLIFSNLSLILVNRARSTSIIDTLKSQNRAFVGVSLGTIALLSAVYCLPHLRLLFGFAPLHFPDLGIAIAAGFSTLFLTNLIRWSLRRRTVID